MADYQQTGTVTNDVDDVEDFQYNSLMSEVMAAVEGISLKDVDITMTYAGGTASDLLSTVTITDNETGGTTNKIDCTITLTYDGSDDLTQTTYFFTTLDRELVEVYTYTGDDITAVARTIAFAPSINDTVTVAEAVSVSIV